MSLGGGLEMTTDDDKFHARTALVMGQLVLRLEGTLSHADPGRILDPFLRQVHEVAAKQGAKVVLVDFTRLEFMNSASFKAFIGWVAIIQAMPVKDRYHLRFEITRARRWQSASVHALGCFGSELVECDDGT